MFTDIHTHAFHPKIAAKAVDHLNSYYDVQCAGTGTIDDLKERQKRSGIDRFVVLCAATEPAQVIPANNYALSLHREHPEIIAFGTIHPGFVEWERQLNRLHEQGIRGIKLHPEFQNFWLDDPRLMPILEYAQDHFIFEIHIGDYKPPHENPSCPYKVAALLDRFPRLQLIAAHMGGYQQWEHALKALVGRDVWLETSSTTPFVQEELMHRLLRAHPRERTLFGSDYPLYDPGEEMHRLQCLAKLSDTELETILSNADALLPPANAVATGVLNATGAMGAVGAKGKPVPPSTAHGA